MVAQGREGEGRAILAAARFAALARAADRDQRAMMLALIDGHALVLEAWEMAAGWSTSPASSHVRTDEETALLHMAKEHTRNARTCLQNAAKCIEAILKTCAECTPGEGCPANEQPDPAREVAHGRDETDDLLEGLGKSEPPATPGASNAGHRPRSPTSSPV